MTSFFLVGNVSFCVSYSYPRKLVIAPRSLFDCKLDFSDFFPLSFFSAVNFPYFLFHITLREKNLSSFEFFPSPSTSCSPSILTVPSSFYLRSIENAMALQPCSRECTYIPSHTFCGAGLNPLDPWTWAFTAPPPLHKPVRHPSSDEAGFPLR